MRSWTIALSLLLLVLQVRLWAGEGGIAEGRQLQQRIEQQQAHNQQLSGRNARLSADVADLRDRLESIEERAQMDLGMVGAGETFYLLVDVPAVAFSH